MGQLAQNSHGSKQVEGVVWELNGLQMPRSLRWEGRIQGVLVLDVDGTVTRPGFDYLVDSGAIAAVGDFLLKGGHVIFCTGATRGRVEDTVLTPLFTYVEGHPNAKVENVSSNIILIPENGSALLTISKVAITENRLHYIWNRIHQLHVPQKKELRDMLEKWVVPMYPGTQVWSDQPTDPMPRDYIVSLKGLPRGTPPQVVQEILKLQPGHPEINWDTIRITAARTTVDFIHAESGKTKALRWLLKECSGLINMTGPILGFGDLGDEFAKVVPTFNVNRNRPNEFRMRQMPALDFCSSWRLLNKEQYVSVGKDKKQKILSIEDGKEISVVRDQDSLVVYARKEVDSYRMNADHNFSVPGKEVMRVATSDDGNPIQIEFKIPDPKKKFELLAKDSFIKLRGPNGFIIRDAETEKELNVLCTSSGELVYADRISRTTGFPHICSEEVGSPIEIFNYGSTRVGHYEIQDAGQSTAWLIRRLMDIGYFSEV